MNWQRNKDNYVWRWLYASFASSTGFDIVYAHKRSRQLTSNVGRRLYFTIRFPISFRGDWTIYMIARNRYELVVLPATRAGNANAKPNVNSTTRSQYLYQHDINEIRQYKNPKWLDCGKRSECDLTTNNLLRFEPQKSTTKNPKAWEDGTFTLYLANSLYMAAIKSASFRDASFSIRSTRSYEPGSAALQQGRCSFHRLVPSACLLDNLARSSLQTFIDFARPLHVGHSRSEVWEFLVNSRRDADRSPPPRLPQKGYHADWFLLITLSARAAQILAIANPCS